MRKSLIRKTNSSKKKTNDKSKTLRKPSPNETDTKKNDTGKQRKLRRKSTITTTNTADTRGRPRKSLTPAKTTPAKTTPAKTTPAKTSKTKAVVDNAVNVEEMDDITVKTGNAKGKKSGKKTNIRRKSVKTNPDDSADEQHSADDNGSYLSSNQVSSDSNTLPKNDEIYDVNEEADLGGKYSYTNNIVRLQDNVVFCVFYSRRVQFGEFTSESSVNQLYPITNKHIFMIKLYIQTK